GAGALLRAASAQARFRLARLARTGGRVGGGDRLAEKISRGELAHGRTAAAGAALRRATKIVRWGGESIGSCATGAGQFPQRTSGAWIGASTQRYRLTSCRNAGHLTKSTDRRSTTKSGGRDSSCTRKPRRSPPPPKSGPAAPPPTDALSARRGLSVSIRLPLIL